MTSRAYKSRIAASKADIEATARRIAGRFAHTNPETVREAVRALAGISITPEFAEQIFRESQP